MRTARLLQPVGIAPASVTTAAVCFRFANGTVRDVDGFRLPVILFLVPMELITIIFGVPGANLYMSLLQRPKHTILGTDSALPD